MAYFNMICQLAYTHIDQLAYIINALIRAIA